MKSTVDEYKKKFLGISHVAKIITKLIDNWLGRSTVDLVSELDKVEQSQNLEKEKNKARALIWCKDSGIKKRDKVVLVKKIM